MPKTQGLPDLVSCTANGTCGESELGITELFTASMTDNELSMLSGSVIDERPIVKSRFNYLLHRARLKLAYSILLRNEDLGALLPWVNIVTHYVMPIIVVLDWLYQPPQSELAVKQIAYWLIFPLIYLAYSIIRGPIVGFYAYPFFNPAKVGGYSGVSLYCVGILAVFLFVSWLLLTLGNKLSAKVV